MNNEILISVMLPTRHRVDLVKRSISGLLEKARQPAKIEILIAYDDDDTGSKDYFSSEWNVLIDSFGAHTQVFETPQWGYGELNDYYNLMSKNAKGQWLLLWNDDALMMDHAWDSAIEQHKNFLGMIHMTTENFGKNLTLFPLVPREWIGLFGCLSLSNLNDSWIQDICYAANTVLKIEPRIFHDRFDVTGNNHDSTYLNRNYRKKRHNSEEMKQERLSWAQRWRDFVDQQTVAYDSSKHQTQDQ